jgi:osmoprotectant transport system ATP-binding protein
MIKVEQVSKKFGNHFAVAEVSFSVISGETMVILGSSGSGKTTVLKMLNRLLEPTSGKIYIDSKEISTQEPEDLRRGIGYVIQQTGLFPHYTVEENIALVPTLLKWPLSKIKKRTAQLLEILGMPPVQFATKYPHQLSGGQQQRIGLARALAANPPIILMDEPFGALDPVTRHRIRQEFLQLDELKGKTTILVTHDVMEAILLADAICLMDKGKIQQIGTAKELLFQPANAFVQEFFNHNRFQLHLMVHTLEDILLDLTLMNEHRTDLPVFDSSVSLWEVINNIPENNTTPKLIGIRHHDTVRFTNLDEILPVFMQRKKNYTRKINS